jgi:carboxyl-terminal processing protease
VPVLVPLLLLAAFLPQAAAQSGPIEDSLRRFTKVYSVVEEQYADPIFPEKQIYQGAIPGMLQRLDPYSVFFDAEQFKTLQQHQEARSEGFGTIVTVMPGRVVVLEAFTGSPAARAGIQPGDEILEVNGNRIAWLNVNEIVEVLGAARSQRSHMLVLHPAGSRLESITASPAQLAETSVDRAFFLRQGIGYLRVSSFENETPAELKQALEKWSGQLDGLVLDLRENHGGALNAAVEACGLFLPTGAPVLTAQGRQSEARTFIVEKSDPIGQRLALAILVGEHTASAAEILAGALQDNHRAQLVGETTFGKGTVQTVYPLSEGTGLALATARYVTPAGRFIERTRTEHGGIQPDIEAPPAGYNEFQAFLENRSEFLEFARRVRASGHSIPPGFEVGPAMLDDFRAFLNDQHIPVNEKLWSENRSFIRTRLKTEIYNLTFGVAAGDQVAASADPQVQRAADLLSRSK